MGPHYSPHPTGTAGGGSQDTPSPGSGDGFGGPTYAGGGGRNGGPRLHDAPRGVWGGHPAPQQPPAWGIGVGPGGHREPMGSIPSSPPPNPPHCTPLPNAAHRRRRGPPKSQPMGINVRAERRRDGGNLPRPPLAKKLKLKHIPPLLCQENTDRSQQPEQGWLRAQQRRAEGDRDRPPPLPTPPPHSTPPPPSAFCLLFPANASDRCHLAPVCGGRGGMEWGGRGGKRGQRGTAARSADGWRMEGWGRDGGQRNGAGEKGRAAPIAAEREGGRGWGGMGGLEGMGGAQHHPQHPPTPAQPWQG